MVNHVPSTCRIFSEFLHLNWKREQFYTGEGQADSQAQVH